jgi:ankyrin repeat protein
MLSRRTRAKRFILAIFMVATASIPIMAQDSLASLIQSGNRKAALDRIRAGADVNAAQPDGTGPIHWAVYKVDYEIIDALIAKKAKVDVVNEFGAAPLTEAVKLADARMVKTLLAAGANVESANPDDETALMLAIKTGEFPIVEMLVSDGANVNAIEKFHNETPLMYAAAASKNAGAMVKLLLAKDASVKSRSLYSDWPSQISSEPRAQYRPVGGLTALLYAARNGCYDCVDSLLRAGADPNTPTPEGVTALMLAIDNERREVAKLLLDRGANPHVWDWWGRTALYIAVDRKEAAGGGPGAGAGGRGGRGGAPVAARAPNVPAPVSSMDLINMLLAAGVDPNPELNMHRPSRGGNSGRFADNLLSTGCTPLFRAAMNNDLEVSRALLEKGADPNVNTMGLTAFLVAAGAQTGARPGGANSLALMDLMIQHGADVNAQVTGTKTYSMRISRTPATNEGMTALHVAAQSGRVDVVRYLLDKGANPNTLDASGRKAIDLARAGAAPAAGAGPGSRGPAGPDPAALTEIRTMLQGGAQPKSPVVGR